MTGEPTRFPGADTAGARIMAQAWTEAYVALWRGEPSAASFAEWLAGFWVDSLPQPAGNADATSVSTTGSGEVAWYDRDGFVTGCLPGQAGGYRLPRELVLTYPWVDLASAA
ncbi:MAG: hypothetical protein KC442_06510 [Thermomicrobiales bacterium]|nr:hypothetical protein [Thermomicrobiales bacterium]